MDDILRELLSAGKTPESIYKDALNIVKEMNEEKERANKRKKEISEARDELFKSLDDYIYALSQEHMSTDLVEELEQSLIALEDMTLNKPKKATKEKKKQECDILDAFWKDFYRAMK
jgi:hypothetical protein